MSRPNRPNLSRIGPWNDRGYLLDHGFVLRYNRRSRDYPLGKIVAASFNLDEIREKKRHYIEDLKVEEKYMQIENGRGEIVK